MARKSAWADFSDNFNSVNSTLNSAFTKFETGRIKKKDYFGEDGTTRLEGDALIDAQQTDIANVMEKYGDTTGARQLRTDNVTLKGLMSDNRVKKETEQSRIDESAAGVQLRQAQIGQANAAAAASNSQTTGQGLANQTLQNQINNDATMTDIFTRAGAIEFESDEAQTAWFVDQFQNSNLPPEQRTAGLEALGKFGAERLGLESNRLITKLSKAIPQGVEAVEEFYNNEITDGAQLDIVEEDGTTVAYLITGEGEGQSRQVMYSADGETGKQQVMNYLMQQVKDPANLMSAVVDNLDAAKKSADVDNTEADTGKTLADTSLSNARVSLVGKQVAQAVAETGRIIAATSLIDKQQFSELKRQGKDVASTALLKAQTDVILAQIADGGVAAAEQTKIDGLIKLQQVDFFMDMEPDEKLDMIGSYMQSVGMKNAPPQGVSGSDWANLSADMKQAFIAAEDQGQ
tara:strand:- start:425 stop:1807 length:1383 start_codon:yes stop_codon:yes gene_type:complete